MAVHEEAAERFSFEAYARHPFFTEVNRWIVERVICPGRRKIVDLGCGPGAVTKLILERLGGDAKNAEVIGIDPSQSALAKARAAIQSKWVKFVEGSAEWVSRLVSSADAVVFLNAIHLVPDKAQVIAEIRKALKPGGVFAFNTTFFKGAYVEGTSGFWRRWIVRAVQVLRERGLEVKHSAHAVAREFLSAEEYANLCVQAGFTRPSAELVRVEMTPDSIRDIGRFSLFIEGALPGVPLEQASDALQEGLQRTLDETGLTTVPRNWLECVAVASDGTASR
ncbi:MAG TPA: methyltransferase domain-containing protein [Gemmatimonadales bacterium]|nr:methyltransferase domain-containing protein [Gemmatimonadales bacterium]